MYHFDQSAPFQTQAALIHCGEATDKLIIMMLLSTVLFAVGLVAKLFQWVYMKYCRSDKEKVSILLTK